MRSATIRAVGSALAAESSSVAAEMAQVDRKTIEDLYARHGAMVLRRSRAILGDDAAARDALQEVFVRVLREWTSFRREASPVTWLYRITTNLCLNRLRDEGRRRELLEQHGQEEHGTPEASPEQRTTLAAILRRVPEELREVAVYYWIDEMSQDEIADVLGVARRTVGYRLEAFRAAARAAAGATDEDGNEEGERS